MGEYLNSTILITLSIITITLLLIRTKSRQKPRLPPGPPALPIIGHMHLLRPPVHHSIGKLVERYGPLLYLRFGSKPVVVASSPEIVKEILKTKEQFFANRPMPMALKRFDLIGFAFAPYGPFFKFVKKVSMSLVLSSQTVDQLQPIRRKGLLRLLQKLLEKSRASEEVDVSAEFMRMTINNITGMTASKNEARKEEELEKGRILVKHVTEIIGTYNLADYINFFKYFDFQGVRKRADEVKRGFEEWAEGIMREKEESRRRKKEMGGEEEDGAVKDLFDILLDIHHDENAEVKITRDNIKGYVLVRTCLII